MTLFQFDKYVRNQATYIRKSDFIFLKQFLFFQNSFFIQLVIFSQFFNQEFLSMFLPGTRNIFVPGDSVFMLLKCTCNDISIEKKVDQLYVEISQIVGIFSTFKAITHDIKRQAIQVLINLNHKDFNVYLVDWFFICILKKYFEIRGVVLLNKAQVLFMYAFSSTNRIFCAKF